MKSHPVFLLIGKQTWAFHWLCYSEMKFCYLAQKCTKTQELGFKILTRWYQMLSKVHMFRPDTSVNCWRCSRETGTFLHIFSECLGIWLFWEQMRTIKQLIVVELVDRPNVFLLHQPSMPKKKYKKPLLTHLVDKAKAIMEANWPSLYVSLV